MSRITVAGNAAGTATFTLASPATNTNRTITLPDETGELATVADVAAAVAAIPVTEIGVGQTWQNVIGSRAHSTSYQNTTGRPIMVNLTLDSTGRFIQVSDDNTTWIDVAASSGSQTSMSFIVPSNWYYRINGSTTLKVWAELR
jgi:hypothetical protein